jgi:hypothetical protein
VREDCETKKGNRSQTAGTGGAITSGNSSILTLYVGYTEHGQPQPRQNRWERFAAARDIPNATVESLDTGHFALEPHPNEIAESMPKLLSQALT